MPGAESNRERPNPARGAFAGRTSEPPGYRGRAGAPPSVRLWHALTARDVAEALGIGERGLSDDQAADRLGQHGPNRLPQRPPPSALAVFARQFRSPLIYVLGAAGLLSVSVGEPRDAVFICVVLVVNALVGGVQEWRADRSGRALQSLLRVRASVLRGGEVREVDAEQVVPGDVVLVESGNRVPADLRLLMTHALQIDESLLTGESVPVSKSADAAPADDAALADRPNMAYAGTTVTRGRGRGIVVATGAATAIGEIAHAVDVAEGGKPPLIERMERFARAVGVVTVVASVAVGVVGVALRGYGVSEMAFFAIALAVSAVPEGLPVALTVALAVATRRMARRGVIVRRLAAVEGLGSCTLIASDKTGTLTCNELTVREARLPCGAVFSVSGEGYAPVGQILGDGRPADPNAEMMLSLRALARAVVLCNEAELYREDHVRPAHGKDGWAWRGDPTDVALLSFGHKLGWTREGAEGASPLVGQIPFEPEHKFAATYHAVEGGRMMVLAKGAPERIIAMCRAEPEAVEGWLAAAREMAARGLRVLAVAEGAVAMPVASAVPPVPSDLRFLGLVGMVDPLRHEAAEAVKRCRDAGITVWMVTGDHPVTALAIARELGMATRQEEVVTGAELDRLSPEGVRAVVDSAKVFARVTPQQKLMLVQAARDAGHFVAVTGDGVNDAPALRAANVGVAMGRAGTDVAREAAALVIVDDDFATIVAGVEEGRIAYNNIRNVIFMVASTGAGEVVLAAAAMAAGLPLPLVAVQLLWLNLVTNGIQDVALAFEPGLGDELRRRPRPPHERIFDRLMIERTVLAAAVIGGIGIAAFWWMLRAGWPETAARNALLLLVVLFENVHIGNCRSETRPALSMSPLRSPVLFLGTAAALLLHVTAMYVPVLRRTLGTEPVTASVWASLLGLALLLFVVMETHKLLRRGTIGGASKVRPRYL